MDISPDNKSLYNTIFIGGGTATLSFLLHANRNNK